MSDLRESLAEMSVESAIGRVLGWFVDDTELPDDIKVALTKLIEAARGWSDPNRLIEELKARGAETLMAQWGYKIDKLRGIPVESSGRYLVYRLEGEK